MLITVFIESRYATSYVFFFSSRRRHTRWTGDWSSDVCSSDLAAKHANATHVSVAISSQHGRVIVRIADDGDGFDVTAHRSRRGFGLVTMSERRSEERRVGKGCMTRRSWSLGRRKVSVRLYLR